MGTAAAHARLHGGLPQDSAYLHDFLTQNAALAGHLSMISCPQKVVRAIDELAVRAAS